MSHFTTIQTQIRDLDALQDACSDLGLRLATNARCSGYASQSRLAPHVIQLKGPYDVAVEPSRETDGIYGLTTDWWDGHVAKEVGSGYSRLLQSYGIHKTLREARTRGLRVHRKKYADAWPILDSLHNAWGTKWDLAENEQRQVASELLENGSAFFDTAWSPPLQAIEALSRKFPDSALQLHYCELGMFFAGTATFQDGECHDQSYEEKPSVMKIASDIFGYEDEEDPCEFITIP